VHQPFLICIINNEENTFHSDIAHKGETPSQYESFQEDEIPPLGFFGFLFGYATSILRVPSEIGLFNRAPLFEKTDHYCKEIANGVLIFKRSFFN